MLDDALKEQIKKLQGEMKVVIGDTKKNLILNNNNIFLTEDFFTFLIEHIVNKKINTKLLIIIILFLETQAKKNDINNSEEDKLEFISNAEFSSFEREQIDEFVHPFYTEKSRLDDKIDANKLYTSCHRYYDYYRNLHVELYNSLHPE